MKPLLLLMRHGETDLNKDKEFRGWSDPELNDDGFREARDAARFLKRFPISLVVHSPLTRTTQMAEVIGHKQTEPDSRLLPLNVGVFAGKKKTQAVTKMFDYYLANRSRKIPQGESINDFESRYEPLLKQGIEYGESGKLALFSGHTSNVIAAQNLLEGIKRNEEKGNLLRPGGIAGVFREGDKYTVRPLFRAETGREADDQVW